VIWARGRVSITSCPTSYITSDSIALLEEFHAWKLFGTADYYKLPARVVHAICILEQELRAEERSGDN